MDGGSEFQAAFEMECQRRELKLFVLPPRSPKLNGCVERAQRTHTEEFYEVNDFSQASSSRLRGAAGLGTYLQYCASPSGTGVPNPLGVLAALALGSPSGQRKRNGGHITRRPVFPIHFHHITSHPEGGQVSLIYWTSPLDCNSYTKVR